MIHYQNAREFVLYADEVERVLVENYQNKRAVTSLATLKKSRKTIFVELGFVVLAFTALVKPFYSGVSKKMIQKDAKELIKLTMENTKRCVNAKDNVIPVLLEIVSEVEKKKTTDDAISKLSAQWVLIPDQSEYNKVFNKCLNGVQSKLCKDTTCTMDRPSVLDNNFMPLTNNDQERVFAFCKSNEKKFSSMSSGNICSISLANVNHLSQWLTVQPECAGLVRLAKQRSASVREKCRQTAKEIEEMKLAKRQEGLRLDKDFNSAIETAVNMILLDSDNLLPKRMNQVPHIKQLIMNGLSESQKKIVKSRMFIVIARAMGYDPQNECAAREIISNSIM